MLPDFSFHHIGIAAADIDRTASYYVKAGYSKTENTFDPIQNVNICFLSKKGMPLLELIEPLDETSPVFKVLSKNGVTPYHICYSVKDIAKSVAELRSLRFVATSEPVPACALDNHKVCFLYNRNVGLIELVEE